MNCRIAKIDQQVLPITVFAVSLLEYSTLLGRINNDISVVFYFAFISDHTTVYHMHFQGYLINLDI